jgi:curved DNA-binding protein CbpA
VRQPITVVTNGTSHARDSAIWTEGRTVRGAFWRLDQNITTQWHVCYGGCGVMIYWHVKNSLCIHSQLKLPSSSGVASMIEGVVHHCTEMELDGQYVDSRSQSTVLVRHRLRRPSGHETGASFFPDTVANTGSTSDPRTTEVRQFMIDFYALLGVPRDADRATIRRAYWEKARVTHPDVGGSQEAFAQIKMAHDILTDEALRKRYDETGEADEPPVDNRRAQLMEVLSIALDQAMLKLSQDSKAPKYIDMARLIREVLRERREELDKQSVDLEKATEYSRELLGRFIAVSGDNLMEAVVKGRIATCQSQIEVLRERTKVIDEALDMVSGMAFRADREPRPSTGYQWMPGLEPEHLQFIKR